ncbi:MAG: hypothetical protein GC179_17515 [Anaerolineaceae bacterium]|nr:hypothetical protein [Anaerolineaceae bacterium]
MNKNIPDDDQPDEATIQLIKCAFPNRLRDAEYLPLLYILRKDMTIRAASSLVAILVQKDVLEIYNDALGVNNKTYEQNIVHDLISRLEACGYNNWLDS